MMKRGRSSARSLSDRYDTGHLAAQGLCGARPNPLGRWAARKARSTGFPASAPSRAFVHSGNANTYTALLPLGISTSGVIRTPAALMPPPPPGIAMYWRPPTA
jgi:hypothetical protein